MRNVLRMAGASLIAIAPLCGAARAQADPAAFAPGDVVIRLGAAGVAFPGSSKVETAAGAIPGAHVMPQDALTVGGEVGVFATRDVSVALAFGFPPWTDLDASGSIASVGRIGRDRFGLASLLFGYHMEGLGRFRPWAAIGPAFAPSLATQDGAAAGVSVDNAWGGAVEIGFDYLVTDSVGFFVSGTETVLGTEAHARVGGVPVVVKTMLYPFVSQAGLVFRF